MAIPKPEAVVAFAVGQQAQADGVIDQLKDELRHRGVRDAKLLPIDAVIGLACGADG